MGAIHVTAQAIQLGSDAGHRMLCMFVPLVGGDDNVGELHICMVGEWKGHPRGPFKISENDIDAMIARFEAQRTPMVVDYEHQSLATGALGPTSRAAGWIHQLEKRQGEDGPELWASKVEWTQAAAKMIREGEYRFCSPVIDYETTDRESGDDVGVELFNVALTNTPFLDGQHPIKLSRIEATICAAGDVSPSVPAAQSPSIDEVTTMQEEPTASPDEAEMAMQQMLSAAIDQMAETSGLERAAVVEMMAAMADQIGGLMRDKADTDTTPAEERAMADDPKPEDKQRMEQIEASAQKNEQTILLSRVESVEADLKAIKDREKAQLEREKAQKNAADKSRVNGMVHDGALLETERDDALWMLSNAPDRFERVYAGRKGLGKVVPIGVKQAGSESKSDASDSTPDDLRDNERGAFAVLCSQYGWTKEKALKHIVARRSNKAG